MVYSPNPYQAPEMIKGRLIGRIYGSDKFEDGELITTSTLKKIDVRNGIAETQNIKYMLGRPSKSWVEWLKENGFEKTLNDIKELEIYLN